MKVMFDEMKAEGNIIFLGNKRHYIEINEKDANWE